MLKEMTNPLRDIEIIETELIYADISIRKKMKDLKNKQNHLKNQLLN